MNSKPERRVLCCLLASEPSLVRGSTTGKFCARCGVEVQIAMAGQAELHKHPATQIWCWRCVVTKRGKFVRYEAAEGAAEELAEARGERKIN